VKIVPVPRHAAPVGAQLTLLPAPAGCDFDKPLPVAKVTTERGVNQYTVAIEVEPDDLDVLARSGGLFTITFVGAAPLFILKTIEPSSGGSVVASTSASCEVRGAVAAGVLGTTELEQMEGPYSARFPSVHSESDNSGERSLELGRPHSRSG
jgi:hypothetical protein